MTAQPAAGPNCCFAGALLQLLAHVDSALLVFFVHRRRVACVVGVHGQAAAPRIAVFTHRLLCFTPVNGSARLSTMLLALNFCGVKSETQRGGGRMALIEVIIRE